MNRSAYFNVRLGRDCAERIGQLATTKSVSKSAIIAAAVAAYLSPERDGQVGTASARRCDRLSGQLDRLERGQTLLIETLAFFIRDYLAGTEPILDPHEEVSRARGRARFAQFIEQLARHLQRDARFVRDLEQEFAPDESRGAPYRACSSQVGLPKFSVIRSQSNQTEWTRS